MAELIGGWTGATGTVNYTTGEFVLEGPVEPPINESSCIRTQLQSDINEWLADVKLRGS